MEDSIEARYRRYKRTQDTIAFLQDERQQDATVCRSCSLLLPSDFYFVDNKRDTGTSVYCKWCDYQKTRQWCEDNPAKAAFNAQKGHAKVRGIDFLFTFEEWLDWWGDDLHVNRGITKGKLVMARFNDEGPYHPSNVKKITTEENLGEYWNE